MKSISPIIASILIIVITVAIAGLFYAFTSGMFGSLTSSSNNLVNQQSQSASFVINTIYCSNNILYFDIYNKGNIPININNSQIIFTDNYGNTISINGSNIICNNGNIIPSGNSELCYIINNYFCYYSYTDYIKSTNFIYNGISYSTSSNDFILVPIINTIDIYNSQSISTPSPFQQDIAICNGNPNVNNSFSYVNDPALFSAVDLNGQNVYFTTTYNSNPNIYSWYEGQENLNGITCDVWWVNIPNEISANSNITIYMYVGNSSANYYQQYYPYVGEAPYLSSTYAEYDNGNYVFNYYWNFNGTTIPNGWTTSSSLTVTVDNGVKLSSSATSQYFGYSNSFSTPIIIDIYGEVISSTTHLSNLLNMFGSSLGSAIEWDGLAYYNGNVLGYSNTGSTWAVTSIPWSLNTFYIITQASNGIFQSYQVNYNQFATSSISLSSFYFMIWQDASTTFVYWVRVRAYPPNGIMPSIYIS